MKLKKGKVAEQNRKTHRAFYQRHAEFVKFSNSILGKIKRHTITATEALATLAIFGNDYAQHKVPAAILRFIDAEAKKSKRRAARAAKKETKCISTK
jgi:hypothetical protein